MADARQCQQCGAVFEPRREHARFCSARCRIAWNREHLSDRHSTDAALGWLVSAMRETTGRLAEVTAPGWPQAAALISDAVWQVTLVDATLVRYHQGQYDRALDCVTPSGRRQMEDTLAGLRFVRNQMGRHPGLAVFLQPPPGPGPADAVADWRWKPVPAPGGIPPPGRAWEMSRHQAYQARLAGHGTGRTITRAASFLTGVSATVTSAGPLTARIPR